MRIGFAIAAVMTALSWNCSSSAPSPEELGVPSQVVIAPGAFDVQPEQHADGMRGVTYRVHESYPANGLLSRVRAALPAPEWQALPTDWLNSDNPSSHQRGWVDWTDGTKKPPTRVHQWSAQWRDGQGNVVWYELRYDSDLAPGARLLGPPDNDRVRVIAVWAPKAAAEALQKSARPLPSSGRRP